MMTSTSGSLSSASATRPPQNVPRPVMSTRRPISAVPSSAEPDAAALPQHVVELPLDALADRLGLVHDPAPRVARLVRFDVVEGDGVEHAQLELGREVGGQTEW